MKVRLIAVADYASVSLEGKLNVMGIFSTIQAREVPVTHPQLYLVVQFSVETADSGQTFEVVIALRSPRNVELLRLESSLVVPDAIPPTARLPQIVALHLLRFEEFGEHTFTVSVNGQDLASTAFNLVRGVASRGS